jgi:hypothetical protein
MTNCLILKMRQNVSSKFVIGRENMCVNVDTVCVKADTESKSASNLTHS